MKVKVGAFLGGLVFGIGLAIAGMTQPAKIVGFFDFVETADLTAVIRAHDWDRFAIVYNGAPEGSAKMRDYSGKMKAAYDQLRAAK